MEARIVCRIRDNESTIRSDRDIAKALVSGDFAMGDANCTLQPEAVAIYEGNRSDWFVEPVRSERREFVNGVFSQRIEDVVAGQSRQALLFAVTHCLL